jgi:hypothetical protein
MAPSVMPVNKSTQHGEMPCKPVRHTEHTVGENVFCFETPSDVQIKFWQAGMECHHSNHLQDNGQVQETIHVRSVEEKDLSPVVVDSHHKAGNCR